MELLFKPIKIANTEVKNRFVRSATAESMYHNGNISKLLNLYNLLADNNIGIIITGAFEVCPLNESGGLNNLNDEILTKQLFKLAEICHKKKTVILMQIQYVGPGEDIKQIYKGIELSSIKKYGLDPNIMSHETVNRIIDSFISGASVAYNSHFDGIQIHGAHGYLINRFLSPHFNKRVDEYGGNSKNRCKVAIEIAKKIRKITNEKFLITIKLNCHDLLEDGIDKQEFINICKNLNGYYDAIEVSAGTYESIKYFTHYFKYVPSFYREYSEAAKKVFKGKIFLVGNNTEYKICEEIIDNQQADFISISKGLICEPELITRWKSGNISKSNCKNCGLCVINAITAPLKCYQNK